VQRVLKVSARSAAARKRQIPQKYCASAKAKFAYDCRIDIDGALPPTRQSQRVGRVLNACRSRRRPRSPAPPTLNAPRCSSTACSSACARAGDPPRCPLLEEKEPPDGFHRFNVSGTLAPVARSPDQHAIHIATVDDAIVVVLQFEEVPAFAVAIVRLGPKMRGRNGVTNCAAHAQLFPAAQASSTSSVPPIVPILRTSNDSRQARVDCAR